MQHILKDVLNNVSPSVLTGILFDYSQLLVFIGTSASTKGNGLVAIERVHVNTSNCIPVGLRGYFNVL